MDNLSNNERQKQENETRIAALENLHNERATAAITREEYKGIAALMQRINCDGLITSGDYFEPFSGVVFTRFFVLQPTIVEVITKTAQEADAGTKEDIYNFIKELSAVNKVLCEIVENNNFFETLCVFLYELERAKRCYLR